MAVARRLRDLAQCRPAALSEKAHGALIAVAKGLAMTAIDLLTDPSLLAEAKAEFDVGPRHSRG